jgi:hypothetical protein
MVIIATPRACVSRRLTRARQLMDSEDARSEFRPNRDCGLRGGFAVVLRILPRPINRFSQGWEYEEITEKDVGTAENYTSEYLRIPEIETHHQTAEIHRQQTGWGNLARQRRAVRDTANPWREKRTKS